MKRKPDAIRRRDWSQEEKAVIAAHYAAMGPQALAGVLHGRSAKAIKVKAGAMGLAKRRQERADDPHAQTMVGAAFRMWNAPEWSAQPLRWAA